jgi:hypothetical protein
MYVMCRLFVLEYMYYLLSTRVRTKVPTRVRYTCTAAGGCRRRFDRAMDCYKDEDFSCGVCIADEPLHGILCRGRQQRIVARHDAVAKVLTTRLRSLPGVPLPGARADLKVEVKARKWLIDVAIVCPATKSVVTPLITFRVYCTYVGPPHVWAF